MKLEKHVDKELEIARHSFAHILAKAICELYPETKLTIGPAIEDGCYYDIDLPTNRITPDEYSEIEKIMTEIINKGEKFTKVVVIKGS